MKAEWFLYNESMGEEDIKMTHTHGQTHVPYSIVNVCQDCGSVWSKIHVKHRNTRWLPRQRQCPECGPGVMNEYDDDLYVMPTKVAMREILHMKKCKNYETYLVTGGM